MWMWICYSLPNLSAADLKRVHVTFTPLFLYSGSECVWPFTGVGA